MLFSLVGALFLLTSVAGEEQKRWKRALQALGILVLPSIPVFLWHGYVLFQPGHQETVSHSLVSKWGTVGSWELYRALGKYYFRYLGILPGVALGAFLLLRGRWGEGPRRGQLPRWIAVWCGVSVLYLAATADKLIAHDYYLLPVFPPFLVLAAAGICWWNEIVHARWGGVLHLSFFSWWYLLLRCRHSYVFLRLLG